MTCPLETCNPTRVFQPAQSSESKQFEKTRLDWLGSRRGILYDPFEPRPFDTFYTVE